MLPMHRFRIILHPYINIINRQGINTKLLTGIPYTLHHNQKPVAYLKELADGYGDDFSDCSLILWNAKGG